MTLELSKAIHTNPNLDNMIGDICVSLDMIFEQIDEISSKKSVGRKRDMSHVAPMRAEAKKVATYIKKIQNVFYPKRGRTQMVNLGQFLDENIEKLTTVTGVNLHVNTEEGSPVWIVKLNPQQLKEIILNLILSLKAASNSKNLTLDISKVWLVGDYMGKSVSAREGNYARMTLASSKPIIDLNHILQSQTSFWTTQSIDCGSNLSLRIVHTFMKCAGGHMRVNNDRVNGSCVSLYFPLDVASATTLPHITLE